MTLDRNSPHSAGTSPSASHVGLFGCILPAPATLRRYTTPFPFAPRLRRRKSGAFLATSLPNAELECSAEMEKRGRTRSVPNPFWAQRARARQMTPQEGARMRRIKGAKRTNEKVRTSGRVPGEEARAARLSYYQWRPRGHRLDRCNCSQAAREKARAKHHAKEQAKLAHQSDLHQQVHGTLPPVDPTCIDRTPEISFRRPEQRPYQPMSRGGLAWHMEEPVRGPYGMPFDTTIWPPRK